MTEIVGHDLNPQATPLRDRLPRSLLLLPFLAIAASLVGATMLGYQGWRLRSASQREATARAGIEAGLRELDRLASEERRLAAEAARAEAMARWVTGGCHAQKFLIETLRALPAGATVGRVVLDQPEIGRQLDVCLELLGTPEHTAAALVAVETSWGERGVRVSARDPAVGDGLRRIQRLSLNLPPPQP